MQQSEQTSNISVQPAPADSKRKRYDATMFIAILALLTALVVTGELMLYSRDTHTLFNAVSSDLKVSHIQMQELNYGFGTLERQVQQTQTQMAALQQLNSGNHKTWIFAEVDYLVHLANYNLTVTRDVSAAIALLQTADQRVAMLNDPAFANLRQQLANSITRLQAVPKVDLEGILVQLNALADQSKQLPLVAAPSFVAHPVSNEQQDASLTGWRKALQNSLNTLQTLIIIRHHNQPISALLAPEQQLYLQQNLQLLLQQAQWAALHGQVAIYQASLRQAESWVQQYFAQDAAATRAFRHSLDVLQKIDIQPPLPDISALTQSVQQTANHVNLP